MKKLTIFFAALVLAGFVLAQQPSPGGQITPKGVITPGSLAVWHSASQIKSGSGASVSTNGDWFMSDLTVDTLYVTNALYAPGPLYTQNIIAGTLEATNSLTLGGTVITGITQTVTSGTNTVPSNKAVKDGLALKAGTTNAVLSWTAISNETTYVYTEFYDATNNVKRFTRNP
jgi:hypothetical protein